MAIRLFHLCTLDPNNNKIICPQCHKITYETSELQRVIISIFFVKMHKSTLRDMRDVGHRTSNHLGVTRGGEENNKQSVGVTISESEHHMYPLVYI
jgi:hypothetical protein